MKYKNWKGERLLSSILYLLTPFAFMANPLLFVVCVTAQLVLQTLHGYRFSELFVVLLLNGFVYSSVSLVGLRFYDWIIIFSFVYVFLLKAFILCHCIKEQLETRRQWLMSPYIWRTSQKDITANLSLYGTEWILSRVRLTAVIRKHM